MALVELRGARAVLDGFEVFDSLDFTLDARQSASIIGQNGSGKTTFLRLLSGELWPVRAESRTFDFGRGPTWSPLRARQQIAWVSPLSQEKTVRLARDGTDNERGARLSVRDCVATGLFDSFLLHQTPAALQQRQIEATLAQFQLQEIESRDLNTLSQGQLRRVLLARALVKNPRLVLLDEAASGLDVEARAGLFAVLEELAQSGTTFVFASHRGEELPLWTTMWKLEFGRLARVGTGISPKATATKRVPEAVPPGAPRHVVAHQSEPSSPHSLPLFALRNASVFLDGNLILPRLNWTWPRGVHLRVKGENGSGKSTFLRLLGGELAPAHGGEIERLGESKPRPIWEWRRRIALVSPALQARFHDAMSVREAVGSGFEGGFVAPRELDDAQVETLEQVLDEWNLHPLETRRFDRLSFGQTRRVLLARALVASPEVVLLDEALDGLDGATREFCFDAWGKLARNGVHFAFASHHDEDFPAWTSGEIRFQEGRLVG